MSHIIPFGSRILVKRRKVGEKAGKEKLIVLPDEAAERDTDIADVVYIPDLSFIDTVFIENNESIMNGLKEKAIQGDSEAFQSLIDFNQYLKHKSIKVDDKVMISKYVGITFYDSHANDNLTLVEAKDIIGLVMD